MSRTDVMAIAAHRHRWVLAYRALCGSEGRLLPFEQVRIQSLASAESGEDLTDEEILARVRSAVGLEMSGLNKRAVDAALRQVIAYADYDLHKQIECDEETEEDTYSGHVDRFIAEYGKAIAEGAEARDLADGRYSEQALLREESR